MAAAARPAAVVIGPGRVGRAIANCYRPPAPLIGRGTRLPDDVIEVPLWVATTNDGLEAVLQHTAVLPAQRTNLVFLQNGMLLPWLRAHGLQHNTQVLLYMSATEDGRLTDGGLTCTCGPWARHVADALQANNISCDVIDDWGIFHQRMLVKLLWACIFWLMSAGLGGLPVGVIAQHHAAEVSELVQELLPIGQAYLAACSASRDNNRTQLPEMRSSSGSSLQGQGGRTGTGSGTPSGAQLGVADVTEQLLSYSRAIAAAVPSADMARREFAWRNGFFLAQPAGATPRHIEWLVRAGCADLVPAGAV